jgi:partner of Y14 and mago protein
MSHRLFQQAVSASGIVTLPTPDGERIIPGTRRPDGSMRPTRRVRPGFIPLEDQVRFQSRRVAERQLPPGYVVGRDEAPRPRPTNTSGGSWTKPLLPTSRKPPVKSAWDDDSDTEPVKPSNSNSNSSSNSTPPLELTKAQKKNLKRSEKRAERAQARYEQDIQASAMKYLRERQEKHVTDEEKTTQQKTPEEKKTATQQKTSEEEKKVVDPKRRIKIVRKRIYQAKELRRRRDEENAKLNQDELDKINRIPELEAELERLTISISNEKS